MSWNKERIQRAIGGKIIGRVRMRQLLFEALTYLPDELVDKACTGIWFISSQEDAWALTFRGSDLENRHVIVFSDILLDEDENQIRFTMLHEIGHVLLNHRNSIGNHQTQAEIERQEEEADAFAAKYLGTQP